MHASRAAGGRPRARRGTAPPSRATIPIPPKRPQPRGSFVRQRMPGFRQLVELHLAHQADRDAARQQEQLRAEIVALDLQLASARGVLAGAEEAMNGFLADKRAAD